MNRFKQIRKDSGNIPEEDYLVSGWGESYFYIQPLPKGVHIITDELDGKIQCTECGNWDTTYVEAHDWMCNKCEHLIHEDIG